MMKQAVLSVVGQTNPDWRLIVVDDGYPDDSIPGWFESLKDERITYMRNETNLGAKRELPQVPDLRGKRTGHRHGC